MKSMDQWSVTAGQNLEGGKQPLKVAAAEIGGSRGILPPQILKQTLGNAISSVLRCIGNFFFFPINIYPGASNLAEMAAKLLWTLSPAAPPSLVVDSVIK